MFRLARPDPQGLKTRCRWAELCLGTAFWLAGALAFAADAPIDATAALTQYRCYTCHSDRESLAGPAFADVAARYRDRKDAVSHVAQEIATGVRTGGPWHMPPHPEVSRDEARAMARYIMSLEDKGAHSPGN
jgi:cytochrome c